MLGRAASVVAGAASRHHLLARQAFLQQKGLTELSLHRQGVQLDKQALCMALTSAGCVSVLPLAHPKLVGVLLGLM